MGASFCCDRLQPAQDTDEISHRWTGYVGPVLLIPRQVHGLSGIVPAGNKVQ